MTNDAEHKSALAWLDAAVASGELSAETLRNVRRWLQPAYREFAPALRALIDQRHAAELTRLFWERIPFGTGAAPRQRGVAPSTRERRCGF